MLQKTLPPLVLFRTDTSGNPSTIYRSLLGTPGLKTPKDASSASTSSWPWPDPRCHFRDLRSMLCIIISSLLLDLLSHKGLWFDAVCVGAHAFLIKRAALDPKCPASWNGMEWKLLRSHPNWLETKLSNGQSKVVKHGICVMCNADVLQYNANTYDSHRRNDYDHDLVFLMSGNPHSIFSSRCTFILDASDQISSRMSKAFVAWRSGPSSSVEKVG